MGVFFVFLSYLISHYWWFLTSSPLIIESVLNLFFDYENWIERYVSRQKRKQITFGLALLGILGASFLAFQDIYLELQDVRRDLVKSQEQLAAKGPEEQARAIAKLQEENSQLTTELRSTQQVLSALQRSMQARHLSPEERKKFMDALARQDGQQFGVIEVATSLGCQECMIYRDEIVRTINSVSGWRAQSSVETTIRADVTGLIIGVKDSQAPPRGVNVIAEALETAELPFTIGTAHFLPPDKFMLIVGNKP